MLQGDYVAYSFEEFPFVAKSQKMRGLGVLAKFAIARLYGQFWSRHLQRNLVLCLHFKCMLIRS